MTASSFGGTAKIYQFPTGGRAGLGGRRNQATPANDYTVPHYATVASGSAWYHEEAIREAERVRKN
ncbi:MAG: DUF2735 domain-containing protein [Hyphomicrobiales bacterium]